MTTAIAKLFWSGNSQAIRLPKEFRFEGQEVQISKHGNQVIIEPIINHWAWVNELEPFDESMEQAILTLKDEDPQERDWSIFK